MCGGRPLNAKRPFLRMEEGSFRFNSLPVLAERAAVRTRPVSVVEVEIVLDELALGHAQKGDRAGGV